MAVNPPIVYTSNIYIAFHNDSREALCVLLSALEGPFVHKASLLCKASQDFTNGNGFHSANGEPDRAINIREEVCFTESRDLKLVQTRYMRLNPLSHSFLALKRAFPREKAIFEAWERWMAEIAGLVTAFPCVPAYFNPCLTLISMLRNYYRPRCPRRIVCAAARGLLAVAKFFVFLIFVKSRRDHQFQ